MEWVRFHETVEKGLVKYVVGGPKPHVFSEHWQGIKLVSDCPVYPADKHFDRSNGLASL